MAHDLASSYRDFGDVDSDKICRICLVRDYGLSNNNGNVMIAPCHCRGRAKWVHRSCLNLWRVHQPRCEFSRCTQCSFEYRLQERVRPSRWNPSQFYLFASRDYFLTTLLVQAVIAVLAWLISAMDRQRYVVNHFSNGCLIDNWCNHAVSLYYMCGFLILAMLLLFVSSLIFCCNGCTFQNSLLLSPIIASPLLQEDIEGDSYYDHESGSDGRRQQNSSTDDSAVCWTRLYGCCEKLFCSCCRSADIGSTNYRHFYLSGWFDCLCDGILLLFFADQAHQMAVTGLVLGVILSAMIWQYIAQRHLFVIQKKQLVEEFVVMDLSNNELTDIEPANKNSAIPSTTTSMTPDRSMWLSEEDRNRLWQLGLMDKIPQN